MDLTGITNRNEYYMNHYFSWISLIAQEDSLANLGGQAKKTTYSPLGFDCGKLQETTSDCEMNIGGRMNLLLENNWFANWPTPFSTHWITLRQENSL